MKLKIILIYLIGDIINEIEASAMRGIENEVWFREEKSLNPNLQSCASCKCGIPKIKKRIIGGVAAENTEFPWIVFLEANTDKNTFTCGASVISDKYVLTAAHCIVTPAHQMLVYLHLDNKHNLANMVVIKVTEVIVHPEWNRRKYYENDIALVKLEKPIEFTAPIENKDYIRPVCLPEPGVNYVGQDVIATGWGRTDGRNESSNADILQKTTLPVVDHQNCKGLFNNYYRPDSMICAGLRFGEHGVCQGDSGGPIQIFNPSTGSYVQPGLVSFVKEYCKSFGGFTDISAYRDWITQNTPDACFCDAP